MTDNKEKIRIFITLTGSQAKAFEKLAKKKFGNNRYRRSKLVKLAIEGILGCEGKLIFASQNHGEISPTFNPPISQDHAKTPTKVETNGGFLPVNPYFQDIKNELLKGDSEGAKLFRKLRKKSFFTPPPLETEKHEEKRAKPEKIRVKTRKQKNKQGKPTPEKKRAKT